MIRTPSDADMHQRPGHLIRRAQQVHSYLWTTTVSRDMTPTQFAALTVIAGNPRSDQVAISRESGLDTSTTGTVIERLVARGWVDVDRDPKDKRRKLLDLTVEGRATFDEVFARASSMTEQLVECFDDDEQQQLVSLLSRLVAHGEKLRETSAEAAPPA